MDEWLDASTLGMMNSDGYLGHARVASDLERERLWPMMTRIFPLYEEYTQMTDRVIPLVLRTPQ